MLALPISMQHITCNGGKRRRFIEEKDKKGLKSLLFQDYEHRLCTFVIQSTDTRYRLRTLKINHPRHTTITNEFNWTAKWGEKSSQFLENSTGWNIQTSLDIFSYGTQMSHIVMVGHTICMPTPATNGSRTKVGLHQLGSRPKRHYTSCLFADLSSEILELQGPRYCLGKY